MREFLSRLGPDDRVLVIGDIRQHQGVEAGRPFQQLQDAGMRTAMLDDIVRQKLPTEVAYSSRVEFDDRHSHLAFPYSLLCHRDMRDNRCAYGGIVIASECCAFRHEASDKRLLRF